MVVLLCRVKEARHSNFNHVFDGGVAMKMYQRHRRSCYIPLSENVSLGLQIPSKKVLKYL